LFGDEWRLITDVINYHPFSRGYLRDPEEIRQYFFMINDQRGIIYSSKLNVEPNRILNLPLLLNQRPPSLLYSVSHSKGKKSKSEKNIHPAIGFKIVKDADGKVSIKHMIVDNVK
jgi:hypothetical protein